MKSIILPLLFASVLAQAETAKAPPQTPIVKLPEATLAVVPFVKSKSAGFVDVGLLIDQIGSVEKVVVLRSDLNRELEKAVISAAKDWQFSPATRGCVAVPSSIALRFIHDPKATGRRWSPGILEIYAEDEAAMPAWQADSKQVKDAAQALARARDFAKSDGDANLAAETPRVGEEPGFCLVKFHRPVYPIAALKAQVDGIANTLVLVSRSGEVLDTELLQSYPRSDLGSMSQKAIRRWRFNSDERRSPEGGWTCAPVTFRINTGYTLDNSNNELSLCDADGQPKP